MGNDSTMDGLRAGQRDLGTETPWPSLAAVCGLRVSYAQNFEDIRLARALTGDSGIYIDVGANEPVLHSVTKLFYDRGWRGINVEPTPFLCEKLAAERPRDVNLNVGVAARPGVLTFYERPDTPGLSSFERERAAHGGYRVVERPVPVITLAEICKRHIGQNQTIDFLKLDAEGFERAILEGGDWKRWRPRVILVEASPPDDCGPVLEALGYLTAGFDGINRYFVREEDRDLIPALATPVSALDAVIPYVHMRLIHALQHQAAGPPAPAFLRWLKRLKRLGWRVDARDDRRPMIAGQWDGRSAALDGPSDR